MKKMIIWILFAKIIFSVSFPYKFQNKTYNDKLLQKSIRSIQEDENGLIWFGTYMGLTNFNGYDFNYYYNTLSNPKVIGDNEIRSIYKDSKGRLWSAGFSNSLNLYNSSTDSFETFNIEGIDSFILNLNEDSEGNILVGSYAGLFRFNPESKKSRKINNTSNYIIYKTLVLRNDIYLATDKGLLLYNSKENQIKAISKNMSVEALEIYNNAIIFSSEKNIYIYKNGEIKLFPKTLDGTVTVLFRDTLNNFWVGTNQGLYLYKDENLFHYTNTTDESLSNNRIYSIFQSSQDLLWVGTDNGYSYLKLTNNNFQIMKEDKKYPLNAWAVSKDDQGRLLIGSRSKGLIRIDSDLNTETVLLDKVINTLKYSNKKIYAGTKYYGAYILDNDGKILNIINKKNGLKTNEIRSFYASNDNLLWIGTEQGLYLYDIKKELLKEVRSDIFGGNRITNIIPDQRSRDNIWVSVFSLGIIKYDFKENSYILYDYLDGNFSPKPWAIYDKGNSLYIGDITLGLFELDKQKNTIKNIPLNTSNPSILQIVMDKLDRLWISTNEGLGYYYKDKFVFFDRLDGVQDGEFNPGSGFIDQSGDIYFGGNYGITRINHNFLKREEKKTKVIFTSLKFLNTNKNINLINKKSIRIPNDNKNFVLSFSNLNFSSNFKTSYAIKINNGKWVRLTDERDLTYLDMAPGKYILEVRYYYQDGTLSNEYDILTLWVEPKFYESGLAKLAYLIVFIVSIIFIHHYYSKSKKLTLQEELNLLNILLLKNEYLEDQIKEFITLINKLFNPYSVTLYLYNYKTSSVKKYILDSENDIKVEDCIWHANHFLLPEETNEALNTEIIYAKGISNLKTSLIITPSKNFSLKKEQLLKLENFLLQGTLNFEKTINFEKKVEKIYTDQLTNLYNRRYLEKIFNQFKEDNEEYSVLLLDIDYFKKINDTYGHAIGDLVIESVGKYLKELENLISIRYGGEEFLLITKEKNHKKIIALGETIRKDMEAMVISISSLELKFTVSIGIAIGSCSLSGYLLIDRADKALYMAKNSGRNHVKIKL